MSTTKSIHRIQFALIDSTSCSTTHLHAAASLLSRPDYNDIVTERSISGLCGYPPCPNPLPVDLRRRGRFRISLRDHRVYDLEQTYNYCSEPCVVRSQAFCMSLNAERVSGLSEANIERILGLFGGSGEGLEEGGDLGKNSLIIKEKVDVGAGEVGLDEWLGPANAIEGYVPRCNGIGGGSWSNFIPQPNSRKLTEGEMPFASSKFVSNETDKIISKNYSAVKQDVSKMTVKNIEEPSPTQEKRKPKKPTSLSSKVKLKKYSQNYENGDKIFPTSIVVGNEFDNWNASVPAGEDISDMIAKQLENVVLEEKNTRKTTSSSGLSRLKHHKNLKDASFDTENLSVAKARSVDDSGVTKNHSRRASRPKAKKKAAGENNEKLVIESFAGIRDEDSALYSNKLTPEVFPKNANVVYSKKMASSNDNSVKVHEHKVLSEKKTKSQEKILRSSLKASGSKVGSHSVKWADEENAVFEDTKIIVQESSKEDYHMSERFTSAEACAAALIQAAESVASGKTEVVDAVSEAGILIFPQSQPLQGENEYNDDIHKLDEGVVKWPKKTVLLDTDMFEVQDSWHDTTPEGFSLHLSPFATMWMALFGWISSSSLAYIYGYEGSLHQKFMLVNGKEYPAKVMLRDGQSSEIRQTLDGFICRILPALVKDQMIPLPISTMEKFMGCLLDTMSFMDAIPSFKIRQWHVIVFLFLEALSVHRLPILSTHIMSRVPQLQQILNTAQISSEEYEIMKDLILPFGGSADLPV